MPWCQGPTIQFIFWDVVHIKMNIFMCMWRVIVSLVVGNTICVRVAFIV
jgi:hypothetical protein